MEYEIIEKTVIIGDIFTGAKAHGLVQIIQGSRKKSEGNDQDRCR